MNESLNPLRRYPAFSTLLLLALWLPSCSCPAPTSRVAPAASHLRDSFVEKSVGHIPVDVTKGSGRRPVLLLHELNGQSPGCLDLARELSLRGCKVYVPRFYADFGSDIGIGPVWARVSFSRCWNLFSNEGGTALDDTRKIADFVKSKHPGQSVTVIGNCMTAGHALALLARPEVGTAVTCQPAAPVFPILPSSCRSLGIPGSDVTASIQAMHTDRRKKLISFHYLQDIFAPVERTYGLARLTQAAGAGDRHFIRLGAKNPPGENPLPESSRCSVISTAHRFGHPTITSAKEPDRERFREALYPLLGLPAARWK